MKTFTFCASCLLLAACAAHAQESLESDRFCAGLIQSIPNEKNVLQGSDGWLVDRLEISHLCKLKEMNDSLDNPNGSAAIISDFDSQLEKLGMRLIVVPVPPKSAIYPEAMSAGKEIPANLAKNYSDFYARFCETLRKSGVDTINLCDLYQSAKADTKLFYCKTDTHWSGEGIKIVAEKIAEEVKRMPFYADLQKSKFELKSMDKEIKGNLAGDSDRSEKVKLYEISGEKKTVLDDTGSPVLLIGDSHCLVFHAGDDMLCADSGLPDLLAFNLAFPISMIAVRGSGATPVRINLARKTRADKDFLKNVKVVVWCFTAKELSEANGGWKKIQIFK